MKLARRKILFLILAATLPITSHIVLAQTRNTIANYEQKRLLSGSVFKPAPIPHRNYGTIIAISYKRTHALTSLE